MINISSTAAMQRCSREWRAGGERVAVVPTMGALHEGHLSLMRLARRHAGKVAATIFVNPTQFGPGEDFAAYPRPLEQDLELCRAAGCDAVFTPGQDFYPADPSTWVEETRLGLGLCGAARPGHFRGVTTVVAKLFNATLPDCAVFGEKDYQQLAVIRRMTRDLDFPIEIIAGPTLREPDGLAMSSRNRYLSPVERAAAPAIYRALSTAAAALSGRHIADTRPALQAIAAAVSAAGGLMDYIELVDALSLQALPSLQASQAGRLLIAARFGRARLIDNVGVNL